MNPIHYNKNDRERKYLMELLIFLYPHWVQTLHPVDSPSIVFLSNCEGAEQYLCINKELKRAKGGINYGKGGFEVDCAVRLPKIHSIVPEVLSFETFVEDVVVNQTIKLGDIPIFAKHVARERTRLKGVLAEKKSQKAKEEKKKEAAEERRKDTAAAGDKGDEESKSSDDSESDHPSDDSESDDDDVDAPGVFSEAESDSDDTPVPIKKKKKRKPTKGKKKPALSQKEIDRARIKTVRNRNLVHGMKAVREILKLSHNCSLMGDADRQALAHEVAEHGLASSLVPNTDKIRKLWMTNGGERIAAAAWPCN